MRTPLEQIVINSQLPVFIFGKPEAGEFALVWLGPEFKATQLEAIYRGLRVIGVVGLVDGSPRSSLTEPIDDETITALSTAYVGIVMDELLTRLGKRKDDSVAFCEGLYSLEDRRSN